MDRLFAIYFINRIDLEGKPVTMKAIYNLYKKYIDNTEELLRNIERKYNIFPLGLHWEKYLKNDLHINLNQKYNIVNGGSGSI